MLPFFPLPYTAHYPITKSDTEPEKAALKAHQATPFF